MGANGILKNTAMTERIKYLNNFWRSIETRLVNCKIKLKLKWTKYCVLSAAAANNNYTNSNNIILLSKTQNCMLLSSLCQQKIFKNYQNFLIKDLKDQFIGINIKQKVRIRIQQRNIDIFWNQCLLELINYLY